MLVDSLDVNRTSGARANYALIENLSQSFKLTVLHGSETEISLSRVDQIKVEELKWNWRYVLSRTIRLLRRHIGLNLSPFFENKVGFSFTFLSLSHSFHKALSSFDESKFNLVFTLSQGESFIPHHTILKSPRFHKKWLAYIHDPYPIAYYPRSYAFIGPGTEKKRRFMQAVFDSASDISFPSLLLSEWMQKFYAIKNEKISVIPHQMYCVRKLLKENYSDRFFDKKKFNLLHAGNLLAQRDPTTLIEAFNAFRLKYKRYSDLFQLTFIGPISPRLNDKVRSFESDKIKFFPPLDYATTYELQKLATVNVIIEANDESSPFLPAKFSNLIMTGNQILVVGPKNSEVIRLLGDEHHFHAEHHEILKLTKIIGQLFETWKRAPDKKFNREDLHYYMSKEYLFSKVMDNSHA